MMNETHIKLSRLGCAGCVRNVTLALQVLSGVEVVHADIPSKTIHLRYPSEQVTLDMIKEKLAEAKYPAVQEEPGNNLALDSNIDPLLGDGRRDSHGEAPPRGMKKDRIEVDTLVQRSKISCAE